MNIKKIFASSDEKKLDKAIEDIKYKKQLMENNVMAEIDALNARINAQLQAIGQMIYDKSASGALEFGEAAGNIKIINETKAAAVEKSAKLKEMLARYDEELALLGPAPAAEAGQAGHVCASCGAAVGAGDAFCQSCGAKTA